MNKLYLLVNHLWNVILVNMNRLFKCINILNQTKFCFCSSSSFYTTFIDNEVYILSATRTPIGSLGGKLSSLSGPMLGSEAIKAAVKMSEIPVDG